MLDEPHLEEVWGGWSSAAMHNSLSMQATEAGRHHLEASLNKKAEPCLYKRQK